MKKLDHSYSAFERRSSHSPCPLAAISAGRGCMGIGFSKQRWRPARRNRAFRFICRCCYYTGAIVPSSAGCRCFRRIPRRSEGPSTGTREEFVVDTLGQLRKAKSGSVAGLAYHPLIASRLPGALRAPRRDRIRGSLIREHVTRRLHANGASAARAGPYASRTTIAATAAGRPRDSGEPRHEPAPVLCGDLLRPHPARLELSLRKASAQPGRARPSASTATTPLGPSL